MAHYIKIPRPLFIDDTTALKNIKRLFMGSGSNGIIFDVTKKGIKVNGYYKDYNEDIKYANLRKPVFIAWEELDKIKQEVMSPNKDIPSFIDKSPDDKYLATLPIVHINDRKYYIDSIRRERRLVGRPQNVYKF